MGTVVAHAAQDLQGPSLCAPLPNWVEVVGLEETGRSTTATERLLSTEPL